MEAYVTVGAGFLLAVLWFDLMFDVQARRTPVTTEAVRSISTYYRRVTTDARPMNTLVAFAMLATAVAIGVEIAADDVARWVAWWSLVLALTPMGIAAGRTVPRAKRLGGATDPPAEQARMTRSILAEHIVCFVAIAGLITIQLVSAASP